MTPCKFKVGDRVVLKHPDSPVEYGPATITSVVYNERWEVWALFIPKRNGDTWAPEEYCSLAPNGLEIMLRESFDDV